MELRLETEDRPRSVTTRPSRDPELLFSDAFPPAEPLWSALPWPLITALRAEAISPSCSAGTDCRDAALGSTQRSAKYGW